MTDPHIVPLFTQLLHDKKMQVTERQLIAYTLGQMGDQQAVDPLYETLTYNEENLSQAIVSALEQLLGKAELISRLSRDLTNNNVDILLRQAAVQALWHLAD